MPAFCRNSARHAGPHEEHRQQEQGGDRHPDRDQGHRAEIRRGDAQEQERAAPDGRHRDDLQDVGRGHERVNGSRLATRGHGARSGWPGGLNLPMSSPSTATARRRRARLMRSATYASVAVAVSARHRQDLGLARHGLGVGAELAGRLLPGHPRVAAHLLGRALLPLAGRRGAPLRARQVGRARGPAAVGDHHGVRRSSSASRPCSACWPPPRSSGRWPAWRSSSPRRWSRWRCSAGSAT